MPFHDAVYFVTTTLTTVGYGDVVVKSSIGGVTPRRPPRRLAAWRAAWPPGGVARRPNKLLLLSWRARLRLDLVTCLGSPAALCSTAG